MATLKEISQRTGYSPATISRILTGDPALAVSDEARKRVLEEAGKLNYAATKSRRGRAPSICCGWPWPRCSPLPSSSRTPSTSTSTTMWSRPAWSRSTPSSPWSGGRRGSLSPRGTAARRWPSAASRRGRSPLWSGSRPAWSSSTLLPTSPGSTRWCSTMTWASAGGGLSPLPRPPAAGLHRPRLAPGRPAGARPGGPPGQLHRPDGAPRPLRSPVPHRHAYGGQAHRRGRDRLPHCGGGLSPPPSSPPMRRPPWARSGPSPPPVSPSPRYLPALLQRYAAVPAGRPAPHLYLHPCGGDGPGGRPSRGRAGPHPRPRPRPRSPRQTGGPPLPGGPGEHRRAPSGGVMMADMSKNIPGFCAFCCF